MISLGSYVNAEMHENAGCANPDRTNCFAA